MPKDNLIFIIYREPIPREYHRIMEDILRKPLEAKGSLTESEYLKRIKTRIASELEKLPVETRVAIVQGVERGVSPQYIARNLLGLKPGENFKARGIPSFDSIIDPEITKPAVVTVSPTPFTTIGFCRTVGSQGAALITALGAGCLTALIGYLGKLDWKIIVLASIAAGGFAGAVAYFTCKGVEAGIPLEVKR